MPIPRRRSFQAHPMPDALLCGIRPGFPGLFPCGGQVAYVLLTSAPVAARMIAHPALPLDLHVLSLSLAFILSQDQTLRCCYSVFVFFRKLLLETRQLGASEHPGQASLTYCSSPVSKESDFVSGTRTFTFYLVSCTCQNSVVANISRISRPSGRNGLQNYCLPTTWPNVFTIF